MVHVNINHTIGLYILVVRIFHAAKFQPTNHIATAGAEGKLVACVTRKLNANGAYVIGG